MQASAAPVGQICFSHFLWHRFEEHKREGMGEGTGWHNLLMVVSSPVPPLTSSHPPPGSTVIKWLLMVQSVSKHFGSQAKEAVALLGCWWNSLEQVRQWQGQGGAEWGRRKWGRTLWEGWIQHWWCVPVPIHPFGNLPSPFLFLDLHQLKSQGRSKEAHCRNCKSPFVSKASQSLPYYAVGRGGEMELVCKSIFLERLLTNYKKGD